ncbi:RNA-directed DNA polymerase [Gossypium australe]|uniref:RNA-directed DNA polymerase n=1 Tax=Gossypium australe TaxID=47621 RepID=A0A5B6WQL2_9ROSI|nr:RNA-directed DNA polymerase [Gossypium australe]
MGFGPGWVDSLMKCVSTISYSMVFNGHIGGLRQSDPLSPFLFLICEEGFSILMRLAMRGNTLRGVKASKSDPQWILLEYENCSSQCVNYNKSTIFFSTNTQEGDKTIISRVLGVRTSNNTERYLGLPNMVGRRKKMSFQILKNRIKQRIDS